MRRSAYVFAPVLAATAATVLSGCHEGVRHDSPPASQAEAAVETRRGGFGASFGGGTVFFILFAGGVAAVARFGSAGE